MSADHAACLDEERTAALLEGRLSDDARRDTEAHLDDCASCRKLVGAASALMSDSPHQPARARARGSTLSRYVVLDVVGAGGMGIVYAAYDPELDRRVAIKILRPTASRHGDLRARMLREAQAMARVTHPNVVAVYDVGEDHGEIFVVMEFMEGVTLARWREESPRSSAEILAVFVAAGRGLSAAHAAGLVHRDFKPENVLIAKSGRVAVTDFGLASFRGDVAPEVTGAASVQARVTRSGTVLGTPAYMAPEQHRGAAVDARTDLFSFSVALWEALASERPFAGDSLEEVQASIARGQVRELSAEVPATLRRALLRGLLADPELRFATIDQLLDALTARPRWRRWASTAGVLAAVALVMGAGSWWVDAPLRACQSARESLAGAWDADARRAVEAAFSASAKPSSPEALRLVLERLDAYASEWVAQREEACMATRVRREQPDEVLAVRVRCLDRQLAELRALARLLAVPDADLPSVAGKAAWALPAPTACADADALLAPIPPPTDRAQAQEIEGLFGELAELRVLRYTNRYKRGFDRTAELVERARALGYSPLFAQAQEVRADFLELEGDFAAAAESLRGALLAAERGRDPGRAARAMIQLVWVVGHQQAERAFGLGFGEHASALLEGLGGDLELEALLAANRGAMRVDAGEYREAEVLYRESLAKRRAVFGERHPMVGIATVNIAVCLARTDRASDAIPLYEKAAEIYAATVGRSHPLFASTLSNLADSEVMVGRTDDARRHGEEALERATEAMGPEHPMVGGVENVLGLVALDQKRFAEGRAHFERALAIAAKSRGAEHPLVAHYSAGLGDTLAGLGLHTAALEAYARAAAIYEKVGDKVQRARSLVGVGNALRELGRASEARQRLEAALVLLEAHDSGAWLARGRLALGRALGRSGPDAARARALVTSARQGLADARAAEEAHLAAEWLEGR